jgi:hypothetical protein
MSTGSLVVEVCEVRQERLLHMLSQIRTRLKAFNNIMTRVGYWQSGPKKCGSFVHVIKDGLPERSIGQLY